MSPRIAQTLREHDALLRTFKEVATLQDIDVELPADRPTDFERGAEAAAANGMRRLSERLAKLAAEQP